MDTPVRTKGQAGARPDRTRAIPCKVRAVTVDVSMIRNIRGMLWATGEMIDRVKAGRTHKLERCVSVVKLFGPTDRREFWPRLGGLRV